MTLVEDFAELFQGRTDAHGTEAGGAVRIGDDPSWWKACVQGHLDGSHEPIGVYPMVAFPVATYGPEPISELVVDGVTITPEWRVRWGCVDWDEGDEVSLIHARNTQEALRALDITSWIERSRSKGYHLWVFADAWVPARTMRRALLAACQIVDAPTREINPKSEELRADQLGNYVRLSYPGALNDQLDPRESRLAGGVAGGGGLVLRPTSAGQAPSGGGLPADDRQGHRGTGEGDRWLRWRCSCGRQVAPLPRQGVEGHLPLAGPGGGSRGGADVGHLPVDGRAPTGADQGMPRRVVIDAQGSALCVHCFVAAAMATRVSEADLGRIAELYREPRPVRPRPPRTEPTPYMLSTVPSVRLGALARKVWEEGPLDGSGRGHTLWKLARLIVEDGNHTFGEALELITDADQRWGKFHDRGDESYIERMLDQAWTE